MTPLTVTPLSMISVRCADGVTRHYSSESVAIRQAVDKAFYAYHSSSPFTPLLITGYRNAHWAAGDYRTFTQECVKEFTTYLPVSLTIYRVEHNRLVFSRNVTFPLCLITWILRSPGNYVIFSGNRQTEDPLGVSGITVHSARPQFGSARYTYVNPFEAKWPVTHSVHPGAWF